MTLLNIGTYINGKPGVKPIDIYHLVKSMVTINYFDILDSDTEPTMVIEITRPLNSHELFFLATELHQDAIAQLDGDQGLLIGPGVHAFGGFDINKFLVL